ncbi:uncharacterized protein J3D65DRAFT_339587 [Phyllosticta citribraziliensis]|uniref:Uncharacterized protein n=1 Tax=Phyllosticta citribraziliensis TaxID=989973 RepID=A0ABR1LY27_9PEZI
MQRLSSAFYSLDNLVAKVTDSTARESTNRKSAIFAKDSQDPRELEPDGKIRRLSLPPDSHPAPVRRNSAVQTILQRTKSKQVVNRFSAYLGRPRPRPRPQGTRSRPVSECTISSPVDFRQGSSAWVSCSESLAQTSLRSDSSSSRDVSPTYGHPKQFDRHKSATPFTSYPILVTVHCPSSDESIGKVTTKKAVESWPYKHPHPLRSNPCASQRPPPQPCRTETDEPWRNRHVSFQADLYSYSH